MTAQQLLDLGVGELGEGRTDGQKVVAIRCR